MSNIIQKIKDKLTPDVTPARRIRKKLRKGAVERRAKAVIEARGGTYLYVNWKKTKVHFLTPTKQKKVDSLSFRFQ